MGDNFKPYPTQVYLNDKLIESDVQENLTIENFKIFFQKNLFFIFNVCIFVIEIKMKPAIPLGASNLFLSKKVG